MDVKKSIKVRGREFVGTVIAARSQKTATVQWYLWKYLPKYERYIRSRSSVKAHIPESVEVAVGDIVVIKECRPLSKTKSFIIMEKRGKDYSFLTAEDQMAELRAVREAKARASSEGKIAAGEGEEE